MRKCGVRKRRRLVSLLAGSFPVVGFNCGDPRQLDVNAMIDR